MTDSDRPRYRVSADRHSARRRLRYVETSHPDDGQCTLCQLDELAEQAATEDATAEKKGLEKPAKPD